MNAEPTIPAALLAAAGQISAGKITFVLGAGCSYEEPTELPLSRELALECHRVLVLNEVLEEDDCAEPGDLSCVADAVFEKYGSQRHLVDVIPREKMRFARPNDGSLIAAALLLEGVVHHVVLLNYDLSIPNALTQLGAEDEVRVLRGPEDHKELGSANVIFLHRNVDAAPDDWVLRSAALDEAWRDRWEEVIAQVALASPVVVFAGLGTPVGVLVNTVRRIRAALPQDTTRVVVDPTSFGDSIYAAELELDPAMYVEAGWCAFARRLAKRVVAEHQEQLSLACVLLHNRDGLEDLNSHRICEQAAALGLIRLGRLRAQWLLDSRPYLPASNSHTEQIADLMLAVGTIERILGAHAQFSEDGLVEFWIDDRMVAGVRMASGRGSQRWASLEQRVRARGSNTPPTVAIVSGFVGSAFAATPPMDVVRGETVNKSIIATGGDFSILAADDIRGNSDHLLNALAA